MLKQNLIRILLLAAHSISLVFLGLGWYKALIEIDITAHFVISIPLFNEKRSVIGTLESLWESGNYWPFWLIFLFGILVPVVKSVVIYYLLLVRRPRKIWVVFVNAISKWAMADVFAVSIFIAFLGARAMENTRAVLHEGFYWFSAYVIISAIIAYFSIRKISSHELSTTGGTPQS